MLPADPCVAAPVIIDTLPEKPAAAFPLENANQPLDPRQVASSVAMLIDPEDDTEPPPERIETEPPG